jgi:hypothetical protein
MQSKGKPLFETSKNQVEKKKCKVATSPKSSRVHSRDQKFSQEEKNERLKNKA